MLAAAGRLLAAGSGGGASMATAELPIPGVSDEARPRAEARTPISAERERWERFRNLAGFTGFKAGRAGMGRRASGAQFTSLGSICVV
jgi:hypothetical protein